MAGVRGENFPGRPRNTPDSEADRSDKIGLVRKIRRILETNRIVATNGLVGGGSLDSGNVTIGMASILTAHTIPIAKITALGTDGSITFDQYGRVTAYVDPT